MALRVDTSIRPVTVTGLAVCVDAPSTDQPSPLAAIWLAVLALYSACAGGALANRVRRCTD